MPTEREIRQTNEQTLRDFLRLLAEKNLESWIELWTEDAVQEMPFSPSGFPLQLEGREAIRKHYSNLPATMGRMALFSLFQENSYSSPKVARLIDAIASSIRDQPAGDVKSIPRKEGCSCDRNTK